MDSMIRSLRRFGSVAIDPRDVLAVIRNSEQSSLLLDNGERILIDDSSATQLLEEFDSEDA